jgi:hypothetical protein
MSQSVCSSDDGGRHEAHDGISCENLIRLSDCRFLACVFLTQPIFMPKIQWQSSLTRTQKELAHFRNSAATSICRVCFAPDSTDFNAKISMGILEEDGSLQIKKFCGEGGERGLLTQTYLKIHP